MTIKAEYNNGVLELSRYVGDGFGWKIRSTKNNMFDLFTVSDGCRDRFEGIALNIVEALETVTKWT
jgi:hypothetical protein